MNKHYTQSILKLFLLIVTAISSGCTQSTGIDSPTPILGNISSTSTSIPCNSSPKTSTIDVEKNAEEWFSTSKSEIPNRDSYSIVDNWKTFCQLYQDAALNNKSWINNPVDAAVLSVTEFDNQKEFLPDKVIVIANPDNHNIVSVVVTKLNMLVKVAEWRVDLVREGGIWQIMWLGTRVKCNSVLDNWSTIGCR